MKKRVTALVLAAGLAFGLCGCSLAVADAGPAAADAAAAGDELIGGYLTTEYLDLFDMEGYLNDRLNSGWKGGALEVSAGDRQDYGRKLYGTMREDGTVEFEGVPGAGIYLGRYEENGEAYLRIDGDEPFTDRGTGSHIKDEGEMESVYGTVYFDAAGLIPGEDIVSIHLNPVYREPDGDVYLTAGTGSSMLYQKLGGTMTQTVSASRTVTDADGQTQTKGMEVKASAGVQYAAREVAVYRMAADHTVLGSGVWASDALPEQLKLEAGTAYVLVESRYTDYTGAPGVRRAVYDTADFYDYDGVQKRSVPVLVPGEVFAQQSAIWLEM